tara:strand:- start:307 stop:903 length:597 start_codon:yes stop_codon:yes gene_type:complete
MTKTTQKKTTRKSKTLTVKSLPLLPRNPFVFEVFDLVSRQRSKVKKIEVLRKYDESHIRRLLVWNFDESIQSAVPEGEVPYADPEDQVSYSGTLTTKLTEEVRSMHDRGNFSLGISDKQGRTTIRRESKHFYQFVKGGNDGLNNIRRESMFINILQGLHPLEAEIICLVKDGRLSELYKITRDVVAEAYPNIVWRDGK